MLPHTVAGAIFLEVSQALFTRILKAVDLALLEHLDDPICKQLSVVPLLGILHSLNEVLLIRFLLPSARIEHLVHLLTMFTAHGAEALTLTNVLCASCAIVLGIARSH